jgi:hypothetical protein
MSFNHVYQRLTNSFNLLDPDEFTGFVEGEEYDWNAFSIEYRSNPRKKFFYRISSSYGGFYNGENFNLSGELAYRYQPYGNVALRFDFNDLRLPENYGQEQLFLFGPRIDLTFTDDLFNNLCSVQQCFRQYQLKRPLSMALSAGFRPVYCVYRKLSA